MLLELFRRDNAVDGDEIPRQGSGGAQVGSAGGGGGAANGGRQLLGAMEAAASSETVSELSSVCSRDDLGEVARALGMAPDELHEDKFRVDRRKLEALILGEEACAASAESFFQKVMQETNTQIKWPSHLKIGARSKKDPHVHIAGRYHDVKEAKQQILTLLDTRNNRVTLKIDVSYTDHSHIIGKSGMTIKKVMEETGCHIHFPDSNRSNHLEKNNQVSIAGEISAVEEARARVRKLMPLIFSFELPIVTTQSVPDQHASIIASIQKKYDVQVMFRTRAKLHNTLVLVKGNENDLDKVKEATLILIQHMCKSLANQVKVHMTLEISAQHHMTVLGKNRNNLKVIMCNTDTQIIFPDAGDPNISSLKKSNVNITGLIDNVYKARQQLLGSLPLQLMFDLPEDTMLDTDKMNHLQQACDVNINIRRKPKQNTLGIVIKGIERHADHIYEARRLLLNLNEMPVVADIPVTYHIPSIAPVYSLLNDETPGRCKFSPLDFSGPFKTMHSPPVLSPLLGNPWTFMNAHPHMLMVPSGALSFGASSGYNSLSNSSLSLGSDNCKSRCQSTVSSPQVSPKYGNSLLTQDVSSTNSSGFDSSGLSNFIDCSDRRAPGFEKKSRENANSQALADYHNKKLLALNAMKQPVGTTARTPTSMWAGYGFSNSSPNPQHKLTFGSAVKSEESCQATSSMLSPPVFSGSSQNSTPEHMNGFSSSNYLDMIPSTSIQHFSGNYPKDIKILLTMLKLEKYIGRFVEEEIDINVFKTLTEADLIQIGIDRLGARKKMLLAINDMKIEQNPFYVSAAPGVERLTATTKENVNSSFSDKW